MRCGKCNSTIPENSMYCIGCGSSIQQLKNDNMIINENNVAEKTNEMTSMPVQSNDVSNEMTSMPVQSNDVSNEMTNMPAQNSDVSNEMTGGYVQNNNETKSSKKTLLKVIPIVAILIVLVVGVILFLTLGKPKLVFKKAINDISNTITDSIKADFDTAKFKLYLQTDFNSYDDVDMAAFNILNELSLDLNLEIDKKNEIYNMDINTKYKNEELVNVDGTLQNKNIYIRFKDNQDYIYSQADFELSEYDDSYITVIKGFRESFVNSLENEYFTKTKQTININGKSVKATKNTLVLNSNNFAKMMESMKNSLLENDKFINAYSKVTGESRENVLNTLNSINTQDVNFTSQANLSIYTKGLFNEFVKFELEGNGTSMSIIKKEDNKYVFNITSGFDSKDLVEISLNEINGETIYHIVLLNEGQKVGLKIGYNVVYDEKITPKNISNSVNEKYLDEEEKNEFIMELMDNKGLVSFVNDVTALGMKYGDTSDYYDDYSDYDDYEEDDEDTISYSGTFTTDDIDRDNAELSDGVTINWD